MGGETSKMVFLVSDLATRQLQVLKFYTDCEQEAYTEEVAANKQIHPNSYLSVRMTEAHAFGMRVPAVIGNLQYENYAYILLPYAENKTVLNLLMAANRQGRKISQAL